MMCVTAALGSVGNSTFVQKDIIFLYVHTMLVPGDGESFDEVILVRRIKREFPFQVFFEKKKILVSLQASSFHK